MFRTRVRWGVRAVVFAVTAASSAAIAYATCPCGRTCANLYCIASFINDDPACLAAQKNGSASTNGWTNMWCSHGCVTNPVLMTNGDTYDLCTCTECFGVCSAQGCGVGASDPEDGSTSCGDDDCTVYIANATRYFCVGM